MMTMTLSIPLETAIKKPQEIPFPVKGTFRQIYIKRKNIKIFLSMEKPQTSTSIAIVRVVKLGETFKPMPNMEIIGAVSKGEFLIFLEKTRE